MHVHIPHGLSKQEAVLKVKSAIQEAQPQIAAHAKDTQLEWQSENVLRFDATIQGKRIHGTLTVEEKEFEIDATLPLLWRMFEGRIEKAIREQVAALGPNKK